MTVAIDPKLHPSDKDGMGRKLFARGGGAAFILVAAWVLLWPWRAAAAPGELPLPGITPSRTRSSLLRSAESLLGTPYRFGGEDRKGIDCSGLVFLVFGETTGQDIPRTVAEQGRWVLPIPKRELVPGDLVFFDLDPRTASQKDNAAPSSALIASADHVGIYAGDGYFLHSASAGSRTGVIRNSLSEAAWARRFLFAGRVVPASALSGLALDLGISAGFEGGQFDIDSAIGIDAFRGAGLRIAATLPLARNFSAGLQGRVEWDSLLGAVRLPLELIAGQNSGFALFAGPALTLGSPSLPAAETGSADRAYEAVAGWIASAGIRWSPLLLRSGASAAGIFAELRFDRYLPLPGQPADRAADLRTVLSLGLGLRYRVVHY